jgi:zinc protease
MRGQANDLATNWMLSRNLDFTRDYLTDIHAVTGDQVCDVGCRYLLDSNLSSVSLNPKGFLQVAASEENEDCSAETRRFQLDNGLTVLLQEDHRVPLVSLRVSFLAGLLGEDEKTSGLAQLASRCLLKGTSTRSAAEIADAIENSGGTLAASAGNNTFTVAAGCLEQDLVMALDLMSDVLLRPTFPKGEIEREKVAQLASIRSESDHLVTVAVRRLRSELFGDHPYANARVGSEDSVAQLSHLEAEDFQNRYIAADNGVLAVFGAVDSEKTEKLIRDVFEAMPVGERAFAEVLPPPALAKSKVIDLSTDKQQAVLVTGFPGAALDSPDRLALELIEEACSDMSSRLFMRIREEMGLAYYVSASQMFGLAPGVFYFYVGTDPDKLDDVQSALADEVAKLAEGGLEPQEYARAKKTLLGKAAMGAQGAGARAAVQSLDELYGFGYDYSKSLEERVEAISLEDVNRVLRKFFHEKPAITLRVSPNL